jgi:enoyl-CoA hydratase
VNGLVTVERDVTTRVAVVTLNDPGQRNSLSQPMVDDIVEAFDTLEADDGVGAVVITGAPPAFCAGANLGNLGRTGSGSADDGKDGLRSIYEGFLRVGRSTLPTIAAVNGAAVGAGMNLALVCDLRLAARRAKFITRFLDLGLHPGGGHTWMLRHAVGPHVANAMLLFGQELDGEAAEHHRLVWRCVDDDALLDEAKALAAKAADAPAELVRELKQTLRDMAGISVHADAVERELTPQVWSARQPFFPERLAAFQARISSKKP